MNLKVAAGILGVAASVIYITNHSAPKTIKNKNSEIERLKTEAEYTEFGAHTVDTFSTTGTRAQDTLLQSNKYFSALKDFSDNLVNVFRKSIDKVK